MLLWWSHKQSWLVLPAKVHVQCNLFTVLVLGGVALTVLFGLGLMAWQLRTLLTHEHFTLSVFETQGLILIGALFGKILPGPLGNEGVKALYLCRHAPQRRPDVFAVLATDRAVHTLGTAIIGLVALPVILAWGLIPVTHRWLQYWPWGAGILLTLLLAGYWQRHGIIAGVRAIYPRLPQPIHRFIDALTRFLHAPRVLVRCTGISIANHLLSWAGLWCVNLLIAGPLPIIARLALLGILHRLIQLPIHLLCGGVAFLFMRFSPAVDVMTTLAPHETSDEVVVGEASIDPADTLHACKPAAKRGC